MTSPSLLHRPVRRCGWLLMGYPMAIGVRDRVITPPCAGRIYQLGAHLYNRKEES